MLWHAFEGGRLTINKKQKYLWLPDHQLLDILVLAFVFYEKTNIGVNANW